MGRGDIGGLPFVFLDRGVVVASGLSLFTIIHIYT